MAIDIATAVLALRPRNSLDFDAACGAVYPAHSVGERDRNVPDRDELEFPWLGHAVVSGARLPAAGASGLAVGPGDDLGDDPHLVAFSTHSDGMVNEALDAVDFVE